MYNPKGKFTFNEYQKIFKQVKFHCRNGKRKLITRFNCKNHEGVSILGRILSKFSNYYKFGYHKYFTMVLHGNSNKT